MAQLAKRPEPVKRELDPNARLSEVLKPIEVNREFDARAPVDVKPAT
jgi:hypothetical protein